jgi:hypothetical protein
MSFKIKEKKEHTISPNLDFINISFRETLSHIIVPYSNFLTLSTKPDIYSGEEAIPFEERHPIFKSIMKLEFQDEIRQFERK